MTNNNSLRIAAAGIAAAGIGAFAALLLAPQSGRRTRRKLKLASQWAWNSVGGELDKAQDFLHLGKRATRQLSRKLKLAAR
jgi:gas vesicle protein